MIPREISTDELVLLRKSVGHWSKPLLAGLENPPVVFTCIINQTFDTTDSVYEFLYDTATGSFEDVKPGMTVWIGSSFGHYNYGVVRARKNWTVDTAYIGEVSEVSFANDLYVTVVDEMAIWAKHVYINRVDQTVYMDRDEALS